VVDHPISASTCKAHERQKLERLCHSISGSAVSEKRLSLTEQRKLRYRLKTPCKDGTTHVIFESPDFITRLATLVPGISRCVCAG